MLLAQRGGSVVPEPTQTVLYFSAKDQLGLEEQVNGYLHRLAVRIVALTAYYVPEQMEPHRLVVVLEEEK